MMVSNLTRLNSIILLIIMKLIKLLICKHSRFIKIPNLMDSRKQLANSGVRRTK
jgi:hypothetical protein